MNPPRARNAMALAYASLSAHMSDPLMKISSLSLLLQLLERFNNERQYLLVEKSLPIDPLANSSTIIGKCDNDKREGRLYPSTVMKNTVSRHLGSQDIIQAIADLPSPASPLIQYMNEVVSTDSAAQFLMSEIYCPGVHGKQQQLWSVELKMIDMSTKLYCMTRYPTVYSFALFTAILLLP